MSKKKFKVLKTDDTGQGLNEIKCLFIVQLCHNLVSKTNTAGLQRFANLATFDST